MERVQALYKQAVLQHNRNPIGYEKAVQATHSASEINPLCGDVIHIHLQLDGEYIRDIGFSGQSCAICTASASMLCKILPGCQRVEFDLQRQDFNAAMHGNATAAADLNEALRALLGVRRFPSRISCAQLPWKATQKALSAPDEAAQETA